jgi:hypothetical protein
MATVINGILSRKLPWGLVLLGVFLVIAVELLGIRSLSFAVGAYLLHRHHAAIFVGGVVRWLVDAGREEGRRRGGSGSEISPGSLFASGLIAAGGIVGLLGVGLKPTKPPTSTTAIFSTSRTRSWITTMSRWLAFAALAFSLYYFARKPLKKFHPTGKMSSQINRRSACSKKNEIVHFSSGPTWGMWGRAARTWGR